jgi:hypothetical protein
MRKSSQQNQQSRGGGFDGLQVAAADSQEVAGRFNGAENIIINNF